MYSYIRGRLVEVEADHVVLDVGGIGYRLILPASSMEYLPGLGEECKIHTYLYLREDAMLLYGFLTKDDLEVFKQLITVSGIGPKGAIGILSALSADDLRFAILSGDAKTIAKAPGIGAKTAQRVILELKDKMSLEEAFEKKASKEKKAASPLQAAKSDAVLALEALGYSSSEALHAVSGVELTEEMDVEEILRLALKQMAF